MGSAEPPGPAARWSALEVEVPATLADELAGVLGAGTLGVERRDRDGGRRSLLRIYAAPGREDAAVDAARRAVESWGLDPRDCRLRVLPVDDGRWVERYARRLRPLPLGRGFLVVAGSRRARSAGRTIVRLTPGRAFGTGEHPTTRLCASALERTVRRGSRWLDLGTGSGILAVVAAALGARVLALDHDPEAVEVARETLRANAAGRRVTLARGSLERAGPRPFDGIAANVARELFVTRAASLAARLAPGGWLLASGLLAADGAEVEAALGRAGLPTVERDREDGWLLLAARRPNVAREG